MGQDPTGGARPALEELVRAHTRLTSLPLLPELRLHLITAECPLWRGTEADAAAAGLHEPWWAFCWPGGQALARFLLDRPELVRGRSVLAFGSGGGAEALAALRSGARSVLCADLDPLAAAAVLANLEASGLADLAPSLRTTTADLLGGPVDAEVVLAGDVFYDRDLALRGHAWLGRLAREGRLVLIGDPSRGFLDTAGLQPLASHPAAHDGDTSGAQTRLTWVFRLPALGAAAGSHDQPRAAAADRPLASDGSAPKTAPGS